MTFSLLVRCPDSGRFGIAIASYSSFIGILTDGIRANTGVTVSHGFANPANNHLAIRLLGKGYTAQHTLKEVLINDPKGAWRQIVVVDRNGGIAASDGAELRAWFGHVAADSCIASGDMLAGPAVLAAMIDAFHVNKKAVMEDRLLAALEAGRDAGGLKGRKGPLPARSAAVVVCGSQDYTEWDLRVDLHGEAIGELRRIHNDYQPHAAYYIERARNPHKAVPAMEFADMLKREPT